MDPKISAHILWKTIEHLWVYLIIIIIIISSIIIIIIIIIPIYVQLDVN